MAKNIAISDELYELLEKLKHPGETFTDVIMRSLKTTTSLMDLAGRKTIPLENWEEISSLFDRREELDHERKKRLLEE